MIDLKDFRENNQKYITGAEQKGVSIDWDTFIKTDENVRALQVKMDSLKAEKNELSSQVGKMEDKTSDAFKEIVKKVGELKESLSTLEGEYDKEYEVYQSIVNTIPSPAFTYDGEELIVGTSDEQNEVLALGEDTGYIGEKPEFGFTPKAHWDILEAKGLLDQDRAVKLSGARFQLVKGKFAQLQFALSTRVINKLVDKGFTFVIVPQLVKSEALFATGYLPNEAKNLYVVNPALKKGEQDQWEEDDLYLIGTSEVPLIAQHGGEVFDSEQLPIRYVGYSSCYRREAGTYGKDTKGLIRLHQFEKVEMVSFVNPEDSEKEHKFLREIEEEIFSELGIPFQRINICTGDLGAPAAKKYDLEAWFPGIEKYVEVTSTSNTTDYQTRRANIKVKSENGKAFAHSLNGTGLALGRALAAIVENYQTEEGDVVVPEVLKGLVGFEKF